MIAYTWMDNRVMTVAEADVFLRLQEQKRAEVKIWKEEYRLAHQEEHNKYNKEYHLAHQKQDRERKQNWYAAKRQLGFVPLNHSFEGSASHHIDEKFVIFIPRELHLSISHRLSKNINMERINTMAFLFLYQQYEQSAATKY